MRSVKRLAYKNLKSLLPGSAPAFLIIGAQKSGTSSLHYYLSAHPVLVKGSLKEIHFFNKDINYNKGISWYENHFKHPLKAKKLFYEATPNYLYSKPAAQRIHSYNPDIKLIVVLRNPVDRAYSAWNMYHNFFLNKSIPDILSKSLPGDSSYLLHKYLFEDRKDFPSFEECVSHELEHMKSNAFFGEEPSFVRKGIYCTQLTEYLKYFSKDQLLVFGFRELVDSKLEMLHAIEKFLGVSHYDFSKAQKVIEKIVVKKQGVRYAEKIDASVNLMLTEYYSFWNQKLFELLRKKLDW
ncbi:MAG: sulfotransferase domain-containing protein [Bacteroidia bacterium]